MWCMGLGVACLMLGCSTCWHGLMAILLFNGNKTFTLSRCLVDIESRWWGKRLKNCSLTNAGVGKHITVGVNVLLQMCHWVIRVLFCNSMAVRQNIVSVWLRVPNNRCHYWPLPDDASSFIFTWQRMLNLWQFLLNLFCMCLWWPCM